MKSLDFNFKLSTTCNFTIFDYLWQHVSGIKMCCFILCVYVKYFMLIPKLEYGDIFFFSCFWYDGFLSLKKQLVSEP